MSWSNQALMVYHGTVDRHADSVLNNIDINNQWSRSGSDFGRGFYTTTSELQARKWAATLVKQPRYAFQRPAVIRFEVDRDVLSRLDGLWFVRSGPDADDYWQMVEHFRGIPRGSHHCRADPPHLYDLVVGPVASDWKRKIALSDSDQMSFHTERATSTLDHSIKGRIL